MEKTQRTVIFVWSYKVIVSSFFKLQIMPWPCYTCWTTQTRKQEKRQLLRHSCFSVGSLCARKSCAGWKFLTAPAPRT